MRNLEKYRGVIPAFYACYDERRKRKPGRRTALTQYFVDKGVKVYTLTVHRENVSTRA